MVHTEQNERHNGSLQVIPKHPQKSFAVGEYWNKVGFVAIKIGASNLVGSDRK
jgi:hypothetical protein